ncbi:MAG: DnaJ domain-containing protein [Deltaproteobacteria bacterium]|nr:DnaJ domain-containing protein [Deltaproteobacteria bacterium]
MIKKVLIIDSDNVHRGMLACMLPADRYALQFARNPTEAFEQLQRHEPDLLLVGHCSEMDDFCQRVRARREIRDITMLLMDERFGDESTTGEVAESVGADAALPFPFTLEQLEDQLLSLGKEKPIGGNTAPLWRVPAPKKSTESETSNERHSPPPKSTASSWEPFRNRVDELYQTLDEKDYYDLLSVARDASATTIKSAYFELSIAFHPDRFILLEDVDLKQRIYAVFKRCTEAFKVLLDPPSRADYDRQRGESADEVRYLDFGRSRLATDATSPSQTPAGRRYLHFAELAERNGNLRSARMYLTLATQCEPDNGDLRERLDRITERISA